MPDKLKVVLCWHMHQPAYCELNNKNYQLPWTYLHGIKDYIEMAAHLEAAPKARVVVNFAPTLLEQIDDYAQQIQAFLKNGSPIHDPLLAALSHSRLFPGERQESVFSQFLPELPIIANSKDKPLSLNEKRLEADLRLRLHLMEQCTRSNKERVIQRFKPYLSLIEKVQWCKEKPDIIPHLSEQFFIDLLMWYHLAWVGETVRRKDDRVKHLMEKESGYQTEDRQMLLQILYESLSTIIPRYKALAERGQIELSFTPYAHPIMPLLINVDSAKEALPKMTLPKLSHYSDGKERVRWHIKEGIKVFKKYFGFVPQGCWPSEGSLSEATIRLLEQFDIKWTASGENVLRNSLIKSGTPQETTHRPYHLPNGTTYCFFRDDKLSDLIGFEFSKWHADDAVAHLIFHLSNIADTAHQTGARVVSIILDGENAWEYYPENGYYFLTALYEKLSKHPKLEFTTFSDCLTETSGKLPQFVAGSWVYGTFSTWVGDKDKNRGWEMLDHAKGVYDKLIHTLSPQKQAAAEHQLAICEGSDWCWWFGDYNPSESVHDFDRLYRLHLTNLYYLLGETPPNYLQIQFTHGGGSPATGGVMRTGQEK